MSYLGIENLHAFVTGARGGIGSAIVAELLGRHAINALALFSHDLRSCGLPSHRS